MWSVRPLSPYDYAWKITDPHMKVVLYSYLSQYNRIVEEFLYGNPRPEEAKQYKGIAYLQRLRLLCGKCHLTKHQGYALVHRRQQEALEHSARINQLSLEETRELVDKAFYIHRWLSNIDDWIIEIGELKGLDNELREKSRSS